MSQLPDILVHYHILFLTQSCFGSHMNNEGGDFQRLNFVYQNHISIPL